MPLPIISSLNSCNIILSCFLFCFFLPLSCLLTLLWSSLHFQRWPFFRVLCWTFILPHSLLRNQHLQLALYQQWQQCKATLQTSFLNSSIMYPTFCSMSPWLNHSYIKLNMSRRKPINGCPTAQFYPSSTPLYLLMPKRWDSSLVSFSPLHPSTNPSPIPKRPMLKMSFDSIYFFATLQPLPIVQTIIIFHLTTPGARDRFPTHTVVPLWSILQKLAAWFILTQIKLLWWMVRCSIWFCFVV